MPYYCTSSAEGHPPAVPLIVNMFCVWCEATRRGYLPPEESKRLKEKLEKCEEALRKAPAPFASSDDDFGHSKWYHGLRAEVLGEEAKDSHKKEWVKPTVTNRWPEKGTPFIP